MARDLMRKTRGRIRARQEKERHPFGKETTDAGTYQRQLTRLVRGTANYAKKCKYRTSRSTCHMAKAISPVALGLHLV